MANETKTAKTLPKEKSPEIREAIKHVASKMGPNVPIEEKKEHAKVLVKIFEKGMTAKQAMNISDEDVSVIYSYAYQLFNSGKYAEACELFKMLLVLDPQEAGFASALAACYHKMKDYETAMIMYMTHAQLSPFDPVPLLYSYDCFLRMGNPEGAYLVLCAAAKRAEGEPKYEKLQAKIEALLNGFDVSTLTELDALEALGKDGA